MLQIFLLQNLLQPLADRGTVRSKGQAVCIHLWHCEKLVVVVSKYISLTSKKFDKMLL